MVVSFSLSTFLSPHRGRLPDLLNGETIAMSEELKYKVGDRVWVVFDRCRNPPIYLSIAKYGRKWITLDCAKEWRFQIGSTVLESPELGKLGAVYESREQWEAIVQENKAKKTLIDKFALMYDSPLQKLSLAQLEAIDRIVEGQ